MQQHQLLVQVQVQVQLKQVQLQLQVAAHQSQILPVACVLALHPDHGSGSCSCCDSGYVTNSCCGSCCVTSFCYGFCSYYLGSCYHFFYHSLASGLYLGYGCSSCPDPCHQILDDHHIFHVHLR